MAASGGGWRASWSAPTLRLGGRGSWSAPMLRLGGRGSWSAPTPRGLPSASRPPAALLEAAGAPRAAPINPRTAHLLCALLLWQCLPDAQQRAQRRGRRAAVLQGLGQSGHQLALSHRHRDTLHHRRQPLEKCVLSAPVGGRAGKRWVRCLHAACMLLLRSFCHCPTPADNEIHFVSDTEARLPRTLCPGQARPLEYVSQPSPGR